MLVAIPLSAVDLLGAIPFQQQQPSLLRPVIKAQPPRPPQKVLQPLQGSSTTTCAQQANERVIRSQVQIWLRRLERPWGCLSSSLPSSLSTSKMDVRNFALLLLLLLLLLLPLKSSSHHHLFPSLSSFSSQFGISSQVWQRRRRRLFTLELQSTSPLPLPPPSLEASPLPFLSKSFLLSHPLLKPSSPTCTRAFVSWAGPVRKSWAFS